MEKKRPFILNQIHKYLINKRKDLLEDVNHFKPNFKHRAPLKWLVHSLNASTNSAMTPATWLAPRTKVTFSMGRLAVLLLLSSDGKSCSNCARMSSSSQFSSESPNVWSVVDLVSRLETTEDVCCKLRLKSRRLKSVVKRGTYQNKTKKKLWTPLRYWSFLSPDLKK